MGLFDHVAYNNVLRYALNPSFHKVFNRSLKEYWDNLTGFDVVKFDKDLFGETETSMHENTLREYGEEGVHLIQRALSQEPVLQEEYEEAKKWLPHHHVETYCREWQRRKKAKEKEEREMAQWTTDLP